MNNRNKLIALAIVAALVALPYWRIKHNSEFFVDGIMNQLEHLGNWSNQGVSTSLNGVVTITGLTLTPHGFSQSINVDSIKVHADMKKLLFSSPQRLAAELPKSMNLSFSNVRVTGPGNLQNQINRAGYWPMAAGQLGAYGCGQDDGPSFSNSQYQQIFPTNPWFNLEINYALVDDYQIDFNINIESNGNWFIAWSGTLTRPNDLPQITFNDTILDTLYYYYVDQGFNKKRNDMCAETNRSSFAAYRLKSAEDIQQLLRVYRGKEMPENLSNAYQRTLAEDVEMNLIFDLIEPQYVSEFAKMTQKDFLAKSTMEVALGENEYQKVELADIDFLALDMETLRKEMEQKQAEAARLEAEANKPKELLKTVRHTIGGNQSEQIITNWDQAVGQYIKVRTKRGRPVFGKLVSIDQKHLVVTSRYMRGDATITIPKKDVINITANH